MANEVRRLVRLAKAQGWRVEFGAKHLKFFDAEGRYRHGCPAKIPEGNFRLIRNMEADLRRAGFKFDLPKKRKEIQVATVADLIKANGQGEPLLKPAAPAKRTSRKGLEEDIMVVLRAAHPNEVDITTLKMKVSMNHPGVAGSSIALALVKLKAGGLVTNMNRGYYRATSADAAPTPPTSQLPQVDPGLPPDAQQVINDLLAAVANAEALIKTLQNKLAAYDQVKKLLVG